MCARVYIFWKLKFQALQKYILSPTYFERVLYLYDTYMTPVLPIFAIARPIEMPASLTIINVFTQNYKQPSLIFTYTYSH